MQNFIEHGNVITVTAAAVTLSGDLVKVGDMIGVAVTGAAIGEAFAVNLKGVYEVPKETGLDISLGDKLYFDATSKKLDKTNTGTFAGFAFAPAVLNADIVRVKLSN